MASVDLRPGERLDDLLIGGFKIIQDSRRFRFSLDAVLLGHFATVKRPAAVVDLGAGTGVLGLILAARGAARVTGVELSPEMAEMARRTIDLNGLGDRLAVLTGDVRAIKGLLPAGSADLVVANPPYRLPGSGRENPRPELAMARHELAGGLDDFVRAAAYLLKGRGRLALVQLAERLPAIMAALAACSLAPKRLRLVHSAPDQAAKLVLIEAVAGGRPGLRVEAPLFVYDAAGGYTGEILAYYQAGE